MLIAHSEATTRRHRPVACTKEAGVGGVQASHVLIALLILAIPVGCGFIASSIAKKKDRSVGGFFALGFVLGILGIIVAAVVSPGRPAPPPGMRAVACARCNAVQNVRVSAPEFTCWQCQATCTVKT